MNWLKQLVSRRRRYDELSESIGEHIDEKIADLMDRGMTTKEAKRTARLEFGNVALIEQRSREVWQWPTLESIFADLRFALRQFRKAPGFTFTVIFVLALGVAASVSIFAFVNAALLRPLKYQDPSRLVAVFESTATCRECSFSYLDYQDWKRGNSVFRSFEVWEDDAYLWRNSAGVESLRVARVSGGFFETLGVTPMLGRLFTTPDDTPAAPRTVVLPYGTWKRFFGGRTDILGESITLDNNAYTVIGVLPRDFQFAPRAAELWVTIHDPGPCEKDRACRPFYALARLKDNISIAAAFANTRSVAASLQKQYPQSNSGQDALVEPFRDSITGDIRPILLILLAGSILLLLIACVNVASLFLVRAESRRREMAVRGALGASVARLAHQLLIEAALLVALSVAVGLPAAWGAVRLLATLIPERVLRGMPYFQSIGFDHRVFIFVATVSQLALAVCTAAPISRLSLANLRAGLSDAARSSSTVWRRFGSFLIVVELTLAIVLLSAAGLLGKSFYRILHVDLNFNPDHLATLEIDADTGYDTTARQFSLNRRLLGVLDAVPGVESAATVTTLPVTCNCDANPYRVLGHPWNGTQQLALSRTVSSDYFATLQTRLLGGRSLSGTDDAAHPPVVLINRTMAQDFFPGEDPIGRTIGDAALSPGSLHQVIGVFDDIRESGLDDSLRPALYFPANQNPAHYFFIVVRTAQDPDIAMPALAAAIHRLDPNIGLRNEFTMIGHLHYGAASYLHSSSAWLTGAFAACALLLGVIGLYGVIAYSVSQRTCEIGVRMALGAQRSTISRLILGEAAFGMLLAIVCVRYITTKEALQLPPGNPISVNWEVLVFTLILAILTGALFGVVPAWKASQLDLNGVLKQSTLNASRAALGNRTSRNLVVVEVSLSLIVLVVAGLLIQSMIRLTNAPLGYERDRLLTADLHLPTTVYPKPEDSIKFWDRLGSKLSSLPGIQGFAFAPSFSSALGKGLVTIEGTVSSPRVVSASDPQSVSGGYFRVAGIPLLQGREFSDHDRAGAMQVAIVNQAFAKEFLPNGAEVGQRIKLGKSDSKEPWLTIVGVVGNVSRPTLFEGYSQDPSVYRPLRQAPEPSLAVLVRASGNPRAVETEVGRAVVGVDNNIPVPTAQSVNESLSWFTTEPRFRAELVGAFSVLALLLAAVGIYGVLSQRVSQRTQEIGIRIALGARRDDLLILVIGEGIRLTLVGIAIGVACSFVLGRFLSSMLYGIKATDPVTLLGVSALLASVALLACYIPARRAMRMDPVEALHCE